MDLIFNTGAKVRDSAIQVQNARHLCIFAIYYSFMKRNLPVLGFIVGIIMPLIGYLVVYLVLGQGQSFGQFSANMAGNHPNLAKVLSLSILANVIPFIFYTNRRLDLTARGIFIATMLYALAIVLLKYVW